MADLLARIHDALTAIRPDLPVTPLDRSAALSAALDCEVLFNCEHVQPTGSFKLRGATNKTGVLDPCARRDHRIHRQSRSGGGVCRRPRRSRGEGICISAAATTAKVEAIRALGARLVVINAAPVDAEVQARAAAADQCTTYSSPYNDLDVVAGQGTLGMELAAQTPDLDVAFVAVGGGGGGGLIGGSGTALKTISPRTRVIGVRAENVAAMLGALKAGRIVDVAERATLPDGTAGGIEPRRGDVSDLPECDRPDCERQRG